MKQVLLLFFAAALWQGHSTSAIDFVNNGYRNVIVSIHPDVPETNGQAIVDNIKNFVSRGSTELYYGTLGYAYIDSVTILLPATWKNHYGGTVSSAYFYEDGDLRVNTPNPLYADSPYTLQPRGCGERGEFIHLTEDFLVHLNDSSADIFGPLQKVFVHEWAKLRYGVFEEFGYPGDEQYPLFFYEQQYVDGGIVNELKPNFCTDFDIEGSREDKENGGSCSFVPETNLPDENCVFVPSGDNSQIRSSYMAAPFLNSVDHFCNDTETVFHHDKYKPTKHNAKCNYQSTWQVIMQNIDFNGVQPINTEIPPPETKFTILYPESEGRFVLVLDRSGSMDEKQRMTRLKQSSIRWINYEVEDGTKIGIVSFSDSATIGQNLQAISDANRPQFVKTINDLNAKGGTCLGDGIMKGMDVLNGANDASNGGAIIFITDGQQSCSNGLDISSSSVINRIKNTGVRIITVAFGKDSDPKLETLAEISGGKTYFVKDGSGLEDINGVFEESNTYQPEVPSSDAEIIITQDTFRDTNSDLSDFFIIDQTLGRDVKITIDHLPGSGSVNKVEVFYPNNTILFTTSRVDQTLSHTFPELKLGYYKYKVSVSGTVEYILVTISSKAPNGEVLPFRTKCWASADGFEEFDASKTKLAVLAQVQQGNRPVLHAKVEAYVENENQDPPIVLELYDNGAGSDTIANDGIYSRYFARYDGNNGRYTLRCQVKGDSDTEFVTQKSGAKSVIADLVSRTYPLKPNTATSPVCCGSNIGNDVKTSPTGDFSRKSQGNSFKVKNVPKGDGFPPSKVTDLKVVLGDQNVTIEFTAPGNDFDEGTAARYELKLAEKFVDFLNYTWNELTEKNITTSISDEDLLTNDTTLAPVEAGNKVQVFVDLEFFEANTPYFLAMKAFDENSANDEKSEISNVVQILRVVEEEDSGLSGGAIAGIVIGCMLIGFLVVVVGYFVNKKLKNK